MTENTPIIWYSPDTIEIFIPIIEKQLPSISVEKKATLTQFIEATREGVMGILIYPEQSTRENGLGPQLSQLTKNNSKLILFGIDTFPTPAIIIAAIRSKLANLTQ